MSKKIQPFLIKGMTCTSCEVIIERKLNKLPGVLTTEVNHSTGECCVTTVSGAHLQRSDIEDVLKDTEYELTDNAQDIDSVFNWKHLVKISLILIALYIIISKIGLLDFDTSVSDNLSYGAIFGIGLIASVSSCIAVVGGLILTFTATIKRMNPASPKGKLLRAHLFFNGGRIISYFLLGGVVAAIGSVLAPSPRIMGILSFIAAAIMILLALDLLGLSGSKKWVPRMPKAWSHRIHDMAERSEWWIPFLLGGLTFFLPCGFTQSMQIYALTTGSFMKGGLTLLVFALGTLPALLGIGVVASMASSRGKAYRGFMLIAGCLVLLLGFYNMKNSLNLLGVRLPDWSSTSTEQSAGSVSVSNGEAQVVTMAVEGINYVPNKITIQKGVPVEWIIDGTGATGCTSVITIPSLGITESLTKSDETIIEFTPTKTGRIPFTCSMGMAYGEFNVVDSPQPEKNTGNQPIKDEECDSALQSCSN